MVAGKIELSVVIVSWKVKEYLRECLESIFLATRGIHTEIFVIDNASGDGSPEMVAQEFPSTRLIPNQENIGFGPANNQALRQCNGRYMLLINPDTLVPGNSIKEMINFLDLHQNAGLVGPEQRDGDGRIQFGNCVHLRPRELFEFFF